MPSLAELLGGVMPQQMPQMDEEMKKRALALAGLQGGAQLMQAPRMNTGQAIGSLLQNILGGYQGIQGNYTQLLQDYQDKQSNRSLQAAHTGYYNAQAEAAKQKEQMYDVEDPTTGKIEKRPLAYKQAIEAARIAHAPKAETLSDKLNRAKLEQENIKGTSNQNMGVMQNLSAYTAGMGPQDTDTATKAIQEQIYRDPQTRKDYIDSQKPDKDTATAPLRTFEMATGTSPEIRGTPEYKSAYFKWAKEQTNATTHVTVNQPTEGQISTLARGIIDGTIDPNGISKRGGLQAAVWTKVKEMSPEFNVVKAGAGAAYERNPGAMNTKTLLNSVTPLLDGLVVAGAKLKDTGSPMLNAPMQWAQKNVAPKVMGGEKVTAFDNLRDDTIAEIERGLLGTGVLSDNKYQRALKNLNTAQTQQQRVAAIQNIKTVIAARLEATKQGPYGGENQQPAGTKAQPAGGLTPAEQAELNALRQRFRK